MSVNPTYYSNENEACKKIEEIIAPYVKNVRKRDKLPVDQKVLLIMDVFSGQMTQAVLGTLLRENILLSQVPVGMTLAHQILDLTVNGYAKRFTKKNSMNGIPIKYDESLMKVKKLNKSKLNSLLLP